MNCPPARLEKHSPLIVALDVQNLEQALTLVRRLKEKVSFYKVGLQLFTAEGVRAVKEIQNEGGTVFLDLKLHDIPHTVASAAVQAGRLGVKMMTLHAWGGSRMIREAQRRLWDQFGEGRPLLIAVTVLTSSTDDDLKNVGIENSTPETVRLLARMAEQAGADGVVASPRELAILRQDMRRGFLIVTPGIRGASDAPDDQARTLSAGEAIRQGADYLVVGRPILSANDPVQATDRLLEEIERAKLNRL
ncbi:MAG: orotidine-5'-phosphate decarboxylase [Acidobacteria bacterium]|nr:orotidine-5'-phosphate decarboxylase [Acidobacteriota bacterium]